MNGRLYDPALGRMLSPDNYTQGGTQGENRYSYVLNNPLKYTDPSGETPFGLLGFLVVEPYAGYAMAPTLATGQQVYLGASASP